MLSSRSCRSRTEVENTSHMHFSSLKYHGSFQPRACLSWAGKCTHQVASFLNLISGKGNLTYLKPSLLALLLLPYKNRHVAAPPHYVSYPSHVNIGLCGIIANRGECPLKDIGTVFFYVCVPCTLHCGTCTYVILFSP